MIFLIYIINRMGPWSLRVNQSLVDSGLGVYISRLQVLGLRSGTVGFHDLPLNISIFWAS